MCANVNTEYELFTKSIYESLLKEDGISTIEVKHDVQLQGRATEHQIDVYWEYQLAGVILKVAIECKNYNSPVSIAKVRDFYGVISDIGNIQGIIVSKKGFQSGAKKYAKEYGIILKEIREAEEIDWKGYIRKIEVHTSIITTDITERNFKFDEEWIFKNNSTTPGEKIEFSINDTNDNVWLYSEVGEKLKNFHQLENELPTKGFAAGDGYTHIYNFDNAFMTNSNGIRFKILSIEFIYDIHHSAPIVSRIEANVNDKAVVKDVISDMVKLVDNPNKSNSKK